jgi:hypothetical protein
MRISTTDQISLNRPILEKKWKYNETVHQLFMDFDTSHDSVMSKTLLETGVTMKLARRTEICLNENYNNVSISEHKAFMAETEIFFRHLPRGKRGNHKQPQA